MIPAMALVAALAVAQAAFAAPVTSGAKVPPGRKSSAIRVEKSVDATSVLPGTEVTYGYRVTNAGDLVLLDVVLTDDKLGRVGALEFLAPGESRSFTRKAVISNNTLNVVEAVGRDATGRMVTDSDRILIEVFLPLTGAGDEPTEGAIAAGSLDGGQGPAAARLVGATSLLGAVALAGAAARRWLRERGASRSE